MSKISKEKMIDLLLQDCPEFEGIWKQHLPENDNEPNYYIALGDFAEKIILMHRTQEFSTLKNLFSTIEKLQLNGDDYVKTATVIGLLENIQNLALWQSLALEEFNQYLLPETARNWCQVIDFWNGEIPFISK